MFKNIYIKENISLDKNMNIIFPIGGKGNRFLKKGFTQSKPIIEVFHKSIMRYLVERLNIKQDKIYVIYYNGESDFKNGPISVSEMDFKDKIFYDYDLDIRYIPITKITEGVLETLEIGLSLCKNEFEFEKPTVILDCDIFYSTDILELIRKDMSHHRLFYFQDKGETPEYSYLELSGEKIERICEKQRISDFANTGVYFFKNMHEFMYYLPMSLKNLSSECYLSNLVSDMIKGGHTFHATELNGKTVYNLGTPEKVYEFQQNRTCFLMDLDGTMVLSDHIYFDVWKTLLHEFHIDLTKELYEQMIQGNSDDNVRVKLCIPYSIEILSLKKNELFEKHILNIKLVDGILEFLQYHFTNATPIVIVTNCNRSSAELIINTMKFKKYIHGLVVGNECSNPKPYPDPYQYAIQNILNTTPQNCIVFEDSKSGILSAKSCNVGMIVGIESSYDSESLQMMGCEKTITNYFKSFENTVKNISSPMLECLQTYFPNSDIQIHDYKLKGGFISDVISFTVNGSLDYIVKLENTSDNPIRKMADLLDLYNTEYYFYSSIASLLSVNTPYCVGKLKNGIILENLFTKNYKIYTTLDKHPLKTISTYIETMTQLHLSQWGSHVKKRFPELKKTTERIFSWHQFIMERYSIFKKKWKFLMDSHILNICDKIVENFIEIETYLSSEPLTMVHGDFKAPNIFYNESKDECSLIDWQYVGIGKGAQDLVFFMIESFDVSKMTIAFKDYMLSFYYLQINSKIPEYDYQTFKKDVEMSAYYFPFFVAIWFGTTDTDSLIDKNFPFFFIQRLFNFYRVCID
jgi:serine/threonine-protein phosphatase 2A regulatory subunit A